MYEIILAPEVIKTDLPELPAQVRKAVGRAIEERLAVNPLQYGKPLRHNLRGLRRIRVSNYRILYRVDEKNKSVYITAIQHRREVYDQ